MLLGGGLGRWPPIAQTKPRGIMEKLLESDWVVATSSHVFCNFSVICLKFGITFVPLLWGQSSSSDDLNLYFVFMVPFRKHVTKYQMPKEQNTNRRSFLGNLSSFVPLFCRISLNFRFGWIREILSSQIKGSQYFTEQLSLPNEFCVCLSNTFHTVKKFNDRSSKLGQQFHRTT